MEKTTIIFGYRAQILFGIEKTNLTRPKLEPIVFAEDRVDPQSRTSYLLLKQYYLNLEKSPEMSLSERDLTAIKAEHTHDGKIICQYCQKSIESDAITIDHFVPYYFGGKSNFSNLRLVCVDCNHMKGGIHPEAMPVCWKIFQEHVVEDRKPSALMILQKAQKQELTMAEATKVARLIGKELAWRKDHGYELEPAA